MGLTNEGLSPLNSKLTSFIFIIGPDLFLAFGGFTEHEHGQWQISALFPGGPSQLFGIVAQESTAAQCLPDDFTMSQYWKFQYEGVYVTAIDGNEN